MQVIANLGLAAPELLLAIAAMGLMMVGVFTKGNNHKLIAWATVVVMGIAAFLVATSTPDARTFAMNDLFVADGFTGFTKILVLIAAAMTLLMSISWLDEEGIGRFEFSVVVLFATLGMLMMISANDLLSLYIGLELQSLSLYLLAAYNRDNLRSTEAGVKYFVLGGLASGMLLFGMSYIYGFTGTTNFEVLSGMLTAETEVSKGLVFGMVFLLVGLAFKVSAAPFHMWTPDVYEGAPTPVTGFFAVAPKIAALALLMRVMIVPFGDIIVQWQMIVQILAVLSMIVGSYAAIRQTNIKRMMAYSSIGHVGYALIGLATGTTEGIHGVLVYLAIYLFMNAGAFGVILTMRSKGRTLEGIADLAGLSKTAPLMAGALAVMLFSMAGIPPLAGFFGKLYVFLAAIKAEMYVLAVIGVLASVVSAFYYIRIIKIMYFDEPAETFDGKNLGEIQVVVAISSAVILLFIILPAPIVDTAQAAATALFAG